VGTPSIELCLQNVSSSDVPAIGEIKKWLEVALQGMPAAILTIRIVDAAESAELNQRYRQKFGATNVLAFPADLPGEIDLPLLGDLVICAPLVQTEAAAQGKAVMAHWAHLVIHGCLHLLGYDHSETADAEEMESLETGLLQQLGLPDPYA
jgi:probable rRNA maturation factor